jgi:small subunit ribosomal protein S15
MFSREEKREITAKFQQHTSDSGSPEVQISLFTARIQQIAEHLSKNKKDFSALRGLQALVSARKKLMKYLFKNDQKKYVELIKELGIRG